MSIEEMYQYRNALVEYRDMGYSHSTTHFGELIQESVSELSSEEVNSINNEINLVTWKIKNQSSSSKKLTA
jgi:hypothetical protein